ncbi:hypothetical protein B0T26DRAFT_658924 [Lasiosphaeria miniovina]|uniref:Uncharacterized protein n=1 Tax=Lasiosphaeria miniovina TaxID=1954250 RepID=A0AA39ZUS3_9PEZI|nr:uncharacterized protein B0T26DRAFT_658924 [Lasiosphaeria miniovina]KAK0703947.1 hypothetical protein B0T26DRAFT_658924 [Lasiosphaeria miniovina]
MDTTAAPPAIQVIDKSDHTDQRVVALSDHVAAPLTAAGSVRVRSRLLALTTNNFTYAMLGSIPPLSWHYVWKMPAALPAPFNNTEKYCRISAWGYGEVVESTVAGLPAGTQLYGYWPLGTAAEDMRVEPGPAAGMWHDTSEHRSRLIPIYNRYTVAAAGATRGSKGWDALMQPQFETAYMLNRFALSWDAAASPPIHPLGGNPAPGLIPDPAWTAEDADVAGALVVLLAPSGKTGLALAHQLRHGRPAAARPRKVVAVGSERSRAFTVETGFFDDVVLYDDVADAAVLERLTGKTVLVNFGARGDAGEKWMEALRARCERLQVVVVGSEPVAKARRVLSLLTQEEGSGVVQTNAGGLREKAIALLSAAVYLPQQTAAWEGFKAEGAVPGLRLEWGQGLDALSHSWDRLAKGEYGPEVGLVYEV